MKTYNACRERAEDQAATKIQTEAMTQARWEQIMLLLERWSLEIQTSRRMYLATFEMLL